MKFIDANQNFDLDLNNKLIIGVDESGVGDYFGPLCAAAVLIPLNNYQKVLNLGVTDSKKISNNKILEIAPKLKKLVIYGLAHLNPSGYNKLIKTAYNANELKMFIHLKAINQVQVKTNNLYDYVFIDQYSTTNSINGYYKKIIINNNWANLQEIKKDIILAQHAEEKNLAVAAASILARELYLVKMQEMNNLYNLEFPLGSSNKVKDFAKNLFTKIPNEKQKEICKLSFDMTK